MVGLVEVVACVGLVEFGDLVAFGDLVVFVVLVGLTTAALGGDVTTGGRAGAPLVVSAIAGADTDGPGGRAAAPIAANIANRALALAPATTKRDRSAGCRRRGGRLIVVIAAAAVTARSAATGVAAATTPTAIGVVVPVNGWPGAPVVVDGRATARRPTLPFGASDRRRSGERRHRGVLITRRSSCNRDRGGRLVIRFGALELRSGGHLQLSDRVRGAPIENS
jgi:hypothetical protein